MIDPTITTTNAATPSTHLIGDNGLGLACCMCDVPAGRAAPGDEDNACACHFPRKSRTAHSSRQMRSAPEDKSTDLHNYFERFSADFERQYSARCAFVTTNAQRGRRGGEEMEGATSAHDGKCDAKNARDERTQR